jgi:hypothetical protein
MGIVNAVQQMELVQTKKETRCEARSYALSCYRMTPILVFDFVVFAMMLTFIHSNMLL